MPTDAGVFLVSGDRRYARLVLEPGVPLALPDLQRPFVCLLWDHRAAAVPDFVSHDVPALARSACRYAVCGGTACEAWHDIIDLEWVVATLDASEAEKDARFMMTSWHTDESIDDVTDFFVFATDFGDHEFSDFLVLHIGGGPEPWAAIEADVRRHEKRRSAMSGLD